MAEGERELPSKSVLAGESEVGRQFSTKLWEVTRKASSLDKTDKLRDHYPLSFIRTYFVWDGIGFLLKNFHKGYKVPFIDAQTGGFYAATKNAASRFIMRKPEEIESLSERAKNMASFMNQLLTPEEPLDSDRTLHSARLIDFILDEDVVHLWLDLGEESYSKFFQALQNGKLPSCLTSDDEVNRVNGDLEKGLERDFQHMVNVSRGAIAQDVLTPQPNKVAARQRLLALCADENGKINPAANISEAFSTLEKEYPL